MFYILAFKYFHDPLFEYIRLNEKVIKHKVEPPSVYISSLILNFIDIIDDLKIFKCFIYDTTSPVPYTICISYTYIYIFLFRFQFHQHNRAWTQC